MRGKKPKIGDVYEVKMPSGRAYVQYTHDGEQHGQLIRVLPGIYPTRPLDFAGLAKQKEMYFTFFTLELSVRAKEVELVSNEPVPESAQEFPIMRKPGYWSNEQGRALNWYIGHGLRLYTVQEMQQALNVRELTPEQRKLSIASIWSPPVLIAEIERGWTPERDEELEAAARKARKERESKANLEQAAKPRFIDHYLYFSKKANAERAAQQLRSNGWNVTVEMGADNRNWLTLAKQPAPIDDIEETREKLERLANELGGKYDGWGAAV